MTTPKKNNNRTAKKAMRSPKNKTARSPKKTPPSSEKTVSPAKKTARPKKAAGPPKKISPSSKKVAGPAKISRPAAGPAKTGRSSAPAKTPVPLAKTTRTSASEKATRLTVKTRPGSAPAKTGREKLSILRPSGQQDDSFFDLVHEVARQIPQGRVTSYGAIAACLGTRLSARMVGWAMLSAHTAPNPVPAHRVVNRNGLLSGRHHYNPPERMQQLLEKEGVVIKDDQVADFKKLFWDPATEL